MVKTINKILFAVLTYLCGITVFLMILCVLITITLLIIDAVIGLLTF